MYTILPMDTKHNQPQASLARPPTLMQQVRAGFLMQGTNLHQYIVQNIGADQHRNVYRALNDGRTGPVSRALKQQILEAAGVKES